MDKKIEEMFVEVLHKELMPALGCTEPIAVAYAAAKARQVLGDMPDHIDVKSSGNIIKNVKGVKVPNSGGLRGLDVAAVLGVVGGDAERELEVLESVKDEDREKTKQLIGEGFYSGSLAEGVANLYVEALATKGDHSAKVKIENKHTFISEITKDGEVIYSQSPEEAASSIDWDSWNINNILEFAETVDIEKVKDVLGLQIKYNSAIADEGMSGNYGARIGKTLIETDGEGVKNRAKARAAAGSDARMNGCSLPVVINSGSGNQGITVSMPVVEYAKELGASEEKLYRALCISNLISLYQKHFIGSLSSFCGAITAASGAGAAITYLLGGTREQIANTVANTLAATGGIICDGAKSSCAAKISSAVESALVGTEQSIRDLSFEPGEGIVMEEVDKTIRSVGYVGRVGMADTDKTVLNIMIGNIEV